MTLPPCTTNPPPHPTKLTPAAPPQIDPDVAFRSRLRRVEVDLRTGVQRISACFDEYLEMVAINEQRLGRPHRYVYGCERPGQGQGRGEEGRRTVMQCASSMHRLRLAWQLAVCARLLNGFCCCMRPIPRRQQRV